MIVRNILLVACLAALCLGTIAGCTPPAEGDAGPVTDQGTPAGGDPEPIVEEGVPAADPAPSPDAPSEAVAGPSTTTPPTDIPDLGDEAPPSTTTPPSEAPDPGDEAPPKS